MLSGKSRASVSLVHRHLAESESLKGKGTLYVSAPAPTSFHDAAGLWGVYLIKARVLGL